MRVALVVAAGRLAGGLVSNRRGLGSPRTCTEVRLDGFAGVAGVCRGPSIRPTPVRRSLTKTSLTEHVVV